MDRISRDIPIDRDHAALLLFDVQNYSAHPAGGSFAGLDEAENNARRNFVDLLKTTTLPNQARLLKACRGAEIEVIYTVIENLTRDGRDRSLDYKISSINVPKGSWDAQVPDIAAPLDDEIVIRKTSSSPFISTNIDYVLRNFGVRSLVIVGLLTDHRRLRHALPGAPHLFARQQSGYCRQITTHGLLAEIAGLGS
jgi:ureidoacrylate peracid hydrolase